MGAPILRTTDLDTLADNIVSRILTALDDAGLITLPEPGTADSTEEVDWGFEGDSADAQENGEPAQADAQSEEVPPPAEEKAPDPAPAPKAAKAKGKAQPDLLGLGDEEDDE